MKGKVSHTLRSFLNNSSSREQLGKILTSHHPGIIKHNGKYFKVSTTQQPFLEESQNQNCNSKTENNLSKTLKTK
ncbi:MAG: hypothetical protein WAR79_13995 [Melioribacteraceae bacterium]